MRKLLVLLCFLAMPLLGFRPTLTASNGTAASGGASFPFADKVEQRCIDLGADCICSEPLNLDEGVITTVNYDFSSSNDTYECGGRATAPGSISPTASPGPTFGPVTAFGSGLFALRGGSGFGDFFFHGRPVSNTNVLDSTHKQACWRIYKMVSSNYGNTGGDPVVAKGDCPAGTTWRNKMFQLNFTNGAQAFQPEEQNYTNAICNTGGPYGNIDVGNDGPDPGGLWAGGVVNISPAVSWDAMKTAPARLEFCVESRDSGGVRGGNLITTRTRIKRLDTGVISYGETPETTGWGTINLYDASGVNADHSGPGNDWYQMFIQTRSTADPDVTTHWPGCSPEVEGTVLCPVAGGD